MSEFPQPQPCIIFCNHTHTRGLSCDLIWFVAFSNGKACLRLRPRSERAPAAQNTWSVYRNRHKPGTPLSLKSPRKMWSCPVTMTFTTQTLLLRLRLAYNNNNNSTLSKEPYSIRKKPGTIGSETRADSFDTNWKPKSCAMHGASSCCRRHWPCRCAPDSWSDHSWSRPICTVLNAAAVALLLLVQLLQRPRQRLAIY